jgi:hypothetical protein
MAFAPSRSASKRSVGAFRFSLRATASAADFVAVSTAVRCWATASPVAAAYRARATISVALARSMAMSRSAWSWPR